MLKKLAIGFTRTSAPWILSQAALLVLLIAIYFRVRGLTVGSTQDAVAHANDILGLEHRLGIDIEGSVQVPVAQSWALSTAANWVYIWGHWPVIIVTLVWLALRHRDEFRHLRDAMMISGAVGMVIFATYPVAPPRLADLGLVDTVTERSNAYRVLQPPAFVNQYAAMPSLHSGWDLLVGIAIVSAASTLILRIFGFAMPILMALAVVLTANHYVLDVIAGVSLVLIAHVAALALDRRRRRRQQERAARWLQESRLSKPARTEGVRMRTLAIAHRAGNSLASLHAANDLGVDVIECDVHEYRDRLEVRHLKSAGPLPFLWDRWELASASAPRLGLTELLEANRHETTFMLDLKGRRTSAARSVAKLLHEEGHHRPVLVCGRYWPLVDALAELPYVRRVLSARNSTELTRLRQRLKSGRPPYGVSIHRSLLDRRIVAELKERVDLVMTWPINDIASLDLMLDMGVTGIISDENEVLAELIRRQA